MRLRTMLSLMVFVLAANTVVVAWTWWHDPVEVVEWTVLTPTDECPPWHTNPYPTSPTSDIMLASRLHGDDDDDDDDDDFQLMGCRCKLYPTLLECECKQQRGQWWSFRVLWRL